MSKFNSWNIDPDKKDYVMDANGSPVNNSDLKTPAYFRMETQRSKWLYAPNAEYGSNFYLYKKRKTASDGSLFDTLTQQALKPIVDDGRASEVITTLSSSSRFGVGFKTQIIDIQGNLEEVKFTKIE